VEDRTMDGDRDGPCHFCSRNDSCLRAHRLGSNGSLLALLGLLGP
jgi:hypothetical protein